MTETPETITSHAAAAAADVDDNDDADCDVTLIFRLE